MEKLKLPIIRHFDEVDDLSLDIRDGELLPEQEEKARNIAEQIINELKNDSQEAVFFVTSTRARAVQTADLIIKELQKIKPDVRTFKTEEENLCAIKEGKFILPEDYKPGDYFIGLEVAANAFSDEVHAKEKGLGEDNYLYRHGDPLLLEDGTFKYPELLKYFESSGENYREVLLRIYKLIIVTHKKASKLTKKTKVAILTHGQPAQIFKDLNAVAAKVSAGSIDVPLGQLANLCWEEYKNRDESERVTGQTDMVSIEYLENEDMIQILQSEVDYLEALD